MLVRSIMIPMEELKFIDAHGTIGDALKTIEEKNLLSLPIADGKKLVGMLSKRYIYERFFKDNCTDKQAFLNKPVLEYGHMEIPSVKPYTPLDQATSLFIGSTIPFLPVTNDDDELCGLVTYQAIFREYQRLYGIGHHTMLIHCLDYKGSLAYILEQINKAGGRIKNIVMRDPEVIGVKQLYLKIEADDIDKVVTHLGKAGIEVRSVS